MSIILVMHIVIHFQFFTKNKSLGFKLNEHLISMFGTKIYFHSNKFLVTFYTFTIKSKIIRNKIRTLRTLRTYDSNTKR